MNEPKIAKSRKEVMLENVRQNASSQSSAEHRENYFQSCEAHNDTDLTEVVKIIRAEYK